MQCLIALSVRYGVDEETLHIVDCDRLFDDKGDRPAETPALSIGPNMTTTDLPKQYDPQDAQRRYYELWLSRGYFHADPSSDRPPYCIVIPPPNVTGALAPGPRAQ